MKKINKTLVNILKKKKKREEYGLFVAEGKKIVFELLKSGELEVVAVFVREDVWQYDFELNAIFQKVNIKDFKRISSLETAQGFLAVVKMPTYINDDIILSYPVIALDRIQDPGNLGTIIRTADWFGIDTVVCSKGSVDVFSPKVVQASMGAIARVRVYYMDLYEFIDNQINKGFPVYAMVMNGENVYEKHLESHAIYLFGNESKGISKELFTHKVLPTTIPNFSNKKHKSESLNVSVSVSVIMTLLRINNY